jgi:hypothetical protein
VWNLVSHNEGRALIEGFEKRVLRRIFGSKKEEVVGGWRRLHKEGLDNLYISQNIVTFIKSRRIRLEGHVARVEQMRSM